MDGLRQQHVFTSRPLYKIHEVFVAIWMVSEDDHRSYVLSEALGSAPSLATVRACPSLPLFILTVISLYPQQSTRLGLSDIRTHTFTTVLNHWKKLASSLKIWGNNDMLYIFNL